MKLSLPSQDSLRAKAARMMGRARWEVVFAWTPRRVSNDQVVWLEHVARKIEDAEVTARFFSIAIKVKYKYGPAHLAVTQPEEHTNVENAANLNSPLYLWKHQLIAGDGGTGTGGVATQAGGAAVQSGLAQSIGGNLPAVPLQGNALPNSPSPGGRNQVTP